MNPQADTAWVRTFQTPGSDGFAEPTLSTDGNYFVYGWLNFQNRVLKISPTGGILWNVLSNHSSTSLGNGRGLLAVAGGGCWAFTLGANTIPQLETRVHALSGAGVETSQWVLPRFQYGVYQAARFNNDIIIVGAHEMARLTPQGDTVWTRIFPRSQSNRAWTARGLQQDAAGDYVVLAESVGGPVRDYQFQLLRIDARQGQVLSDTLLYRAVANTYPKGLLLAPNGDYVITGYTDSGPVGAADIIAAQFRRFRVLPTRPARVLTAGLRVYPNPVGGATAHLQLPDGLAPGAALTVVDALGRVVLRQPVAAGAPTADLAVAALPPGLFVVHLRAADGRSWSGRLLRE